MDIWLVYQRISGISEDIEWLLLNDGVRGNDSKEERWANTKSLQADKLNNVNLISFFSLYFCLKFWGCGNYFNEMLVFELYTSRNEVKPPAGL